jgi:xanthine dehydrogenase accessory factor
MREVLGDLLPLWDGRQTAGVATVVRTWRSAPRPPGAAMVVAADGGVTGSVSGGCVEAAVYDIASAVRDGAPAVLQRFGVSDDDAFAVGLTCGGTIEVFVEAIDQATFAQLAEVAADIEAGRPVAVATVIAAPDPDRVGRHLVVGPDAVAATLDSDRLDAAVRDDARGLLAQGRTATLHYGPDGERLGEDVVVFVNSFAPKPRMIVVGAIDFAAALARAGSFLGYRVTVCDARPTFATAKRFPDADEVVVAWPHEYLARTDVDHNTVVCVLTHDAKFDVPLLEVALRMPLGYVGVMGSRRTNAERLGLLRERGLAAEQLARLHAPIGLDLGARTPEETAVSIVAEIVASRWGGTGARLREMDGSIHHDAAAPVPSGG